MTTIDECVREIVKREMREAIEMATVREYINLSNQIMGHAPPAAPVVTARDLFEAWRDANGHSYMGEFDRCPYKHEWEATAKRLHDRAKEKA